MALTTEDLLKQEVRLRMRADAVRKSWAPDVLVDPAVTPQMRALAKRELDEAKADETLADIMLGLQGCWERMGDEVRRGYARMAAAYEKMKSKTEDAA